MGFRIGGLAVGVLGAALSLGGCRGGAGAEAVPTPVGAAGAASASTSVAPVPAPAAPSPGPAAPSPGPAAPSPAPDLAAAQEADGELLRAAGDGLVTVAVWPDRLPALVTQLNRLVPTVPAEPAALRTMLRDAVTRGASEAEAEQVLALLSIEGLETHRPWVVSVFQPPERAPVAGAATAAWLAGTAPVFTHQVVLPTSAPAAVAERIGALLADWGQPEPVAAGWSAWRRGAQGPRVAVKSGAGYVRLTVETESAGPAGPTWTPATPAAAAHTTGLNWALAEPHAAVARLRTDQLRGWSTWAGLAQLTDVLTMVPDADRGALKAQALSEMLGVERLMGATPPDLTEHVWAVRADAAGVRLRTLAVPHAHLRPAVGAATAATPTPAFALRGPAPVLQGGLAGDLAGLLKAHTPPAFWRPGLSAGDLSNALGRCGHGCALHAALRSPWSNLRGLLDLLAPKLGGFDPVPRSLSWAVLSDAGEGAAGGRASGVVAAAAFAPGPPPPLAELGLPPGLTVQLARRDAQPVLGLSSVRTAADSAAPATPPGFDLASAEPAPAAVWLSAEVARLPELLRGAPAQRAEAARALVGVGTFTFQLRAQAGLWLGDGLLAAPGQAFKPVVSRPPEVGTDEAEGLPADLATCLDRALEGAAEVLGAFAQIEPSERARFVFGAASKLKQPLVCLAADARTAPVAAAVRTELRAVLAAAAPGEAVPADFP